MTVRAAGGDVRTLPSLADILDQQPNAVVAADRDGNLVYANAYATALYGLPDHPSHLVGRSLAVLGFEEGDAPRLHRPCQAGGARQALGRHAGGQAGRRVPVAHPGAGRPAAMIRRARSTA